VSVSVCLSQVGFLSKRLNESDRFLAWELSSTYPTLCFKKIKVSTKIRVIPSEKNCESGGGTGSSWPNIVANNNYDYDLSYDQLTIVTYDVLRFLLEIS